jgi:hypothetical protein
LKQNDDALEDSWEEAKKGSALQLPVTVELGK